MIPDAPAKVLIVDDDAELRDTLLDWLTMAGYDVSTAADGHEALEWASWETFDVVVTDLRMPNLDGLGLLGRLKATDPDVQVIFLSGEATKADTIEALREGRSFDFLEKPLSDLDVLTRTIARAIERRPTPGPRRAAAEPDDGPPLVDQVLAHIRNHLHEGISLRHVAEAFGYSPGHLSELVRQRTGRPVTPWLAELRITKAKQLLVETDLSVAQVAAAVGLPDASYFSRQFRRACGLAPLAWREAERAR